MNFAAQRGPSPALEGAIRAASLDRLQTRRAVDAVVVGAGAAGGMAALRLTQAGLRVLVLDAGWRTSFGETPLRAAALRTVSTLAGPGLWTGLPPRLAAMGLKGLKLIGKARQPVQSRCFAWALAPDAFADDRDHPYTVAPGTRFDWFRALQIGGRMTIPGHGRQYYRLSDRDLYPDDGLSPRWPLRRGELDPWYDLVEDLLGVTGGEEACAWVPPGRVARRLSPSPAEADAIERLGARWSGVPVVLGRSAPPLPAMDIAASTGRLLCRQGAIVREVEIDAAGRVSGVRWFDRDAGGPCSVAARIVFLCASALESTRILLNSSSLARPQGIGSRSGALGRNLMDHALVWGEGLGGPLPGEPVDLTPGRCLYLPRFDLRGGGSEGGRGYGVQLYRWSLGKGRSYVKAISFAEMTPRADNRVTLDPRRRDAWGVPVPRIDCRHSEAERALAGDQREALARIGEVLGVRWHVLSGEVAPPGSAIHECGTARMGDSPEASVLDPNGQCWDAEGLYVTDGAAFPSQGAQNPTLTILALTARACDHAVRTAAMGAKRPRRSERVVEA
jgi:choline dehydrogenase-like flavoprotein